MAERESSPESSEAFRWSAPSTEGGSLTVIYHPDDEIADTLGHMGAIRTHLTLGTPHDVFKRPTPETARGVFEHWKNEPWKRHIEVHIGGSPGLEDHVNRTFATVFDRVREDLKKKGQDSELDPVMFGEFIREHSLFNTLIRTALAQQWLYFKLHRTDHYSLATDRAIVYHPNKAVAMHELGHARYYNQADNKTREGLLYLLPGFRSYQEWQASTEAMKRLEKGEDRRNAMKILEPAWGNYIGRDIRDVLMLFPPAQIAPFVGMLVGHIASRLPFRRRSFGQPLETHPSSKTASNV